MASADPVAAILEELMDMQEKILEELEKSSELVETDAKAFEELAS